MNLEVVSGAETAIAPEIPDPEVADRPTRRNFTAAYKRRILKEADAAKEPGDIGALLRREGLYSSHLSSWRASRERGELAGLAARPRGPKPSEDVAQTREMKRLQRRVARLEKELAQAHLIIDVQKNSRRCWGSSSRK